MTTVAGTIRTGVGGWVFPEWRGGTFYPAGLPQRDELAHADEYTPGAAVADVLSALREKINFLPKDRALDGDVAKAVAFAEAWITDR